MKFPQSLTVLLVLGCCTCYGQLAEGQIPENQVPKNQVPENQVAQNQVAQNQVPENQVPKNQVPKNQVPKNQVPKNQVPKSQAAKSGATKKHSPKSAAPAKPAPSRKFFALTVGSAFTLPECQKRAQPTLSYRPGEPHWCWKDPSGTPKSGDPAPPPVNEDVLVHFPPDDAPVYSISSGLPVRIENSRLQSITFHTNGTRATEEVTEALTSLYGKPTRRVSVTVENNVGDPFPSVNSLWLYTDLAVDYRAVDGDLSLGTVWIETPAARKARIEAERKTKGEKAK